ncbi:hypothetical protein Lal_00012314 [Lupinus albus]|nr:hypothetical protein Lal_00012314 [Lupinus albus]
MDLDSMSLATLFGKLQEHDMEFGCLKLLEESDKKSKGISLKATISNAKVKEEKSNEEYDSSDIDDETMILLVNKFKKILKKK